MVGKDHDSVSSPLQVASPDFEGFEDRKEFLIVDFVVGFGGLHASGVEGDRVDFAVDGRDL